MSNKCVRCGCESAPESKFCEKCGAPLGANAHKKLICPKCRKEFPVNARFCDVDGTVLRKPGSVTSYGKYPKASLGNRFIAWLLDILVILGLGVPCVISLVSAINKLDSNDDTGFLSLLMASFFALLPVIYIFIKDGFGKGQSWGKKASGIMVVNLVSNRPCNGGESFLRNLMPLLLCCVPVIGSLLEPILVLADNDGRRVGDKAANTQVINVSDYKQQEDAVS